MSSRTTIARSVHDVGAASWLGGSRTGAIGVPTVNDSQDRPRVAAADWAKWSPVNAAVIGAHLIGGAGILYADKGRARHQAGPRANTITKSAVTLTATACSETQGAKIEGATEPSLSTLTDIAAAWQQRKYLQRGLPDLTGVIVVLGEQQRPTQILAGLGSTVARRART